MSHDEENESGEKAVDNETGAGWTNASILFEEREKAFGFIQELVKRQSEINDYRSNDQALENLRAIFDKYLEVPSLLDHHIVDLVTALTDEACSLLANNSIVKLETQDNTNTESNESNTNDNSQYECFWNSSLPRILSAIYALSKVRGRKRVQKFLPHQVENLEPVLDCLVLLEHLQYQQSNTSLGQPLVPTHSEITGRPQLWESTYTMWNWMEILGKVPFDCDVVIDASQIKQLLRLATASLSVTGPTRDMAASCLARWLTRPDFEESSFRRSFQEWSLQHLRDHISYSSKTTNPTNIFTTMGILRTLVTILKISTARRQTILASMEPYWPLLQTISDSTHRSSNVLLRKYLVKWWTRLGVLQLPPKVASWRYQRGRRSLKENLQRQLQQQQEQQQQYHNPSQNTSNPNNKELYLDPTQAKDYFFFVPDQVELAMGYVLGSLQDNSTVVRWSAAKGVGRITSRLPAICAEDVIDAILQLFENIEKDNDWHGACLTLAELARRGLLLPHRLKDVIPRIVQAIHYDLPRRQTSVGSHVRDAACYTYWALARAYSPEILRPFVPELGQSIVVAFLFDREVNCRRAASAAFQEMVGRQGAQNFRNGISILTAADYFSLGNRKHAFTTIAVHVAQYEEYQIAIIDHLFRITLSHWDPAIRLLASQSLNNLTPMNPQYMIETVLPYLLQSCLDEKNLQLRHGATLGLAEIVLAFGKMEKKEEYMSQELYNSLAEIIPTIEKKRLYRGKGGEQMRAAVCRLIECISISNIPLTVRQQVRLLDSIDTCLPHPNEVIQEHAGRALFALMRSYFPVSSKGPSARLQTRVVDKYTKTARTSINPAATRGFSLALGYIPSKILSPSSDVLNQTLNCLDQISHPLSKVGDEKDAETRKNALVSLLRACETVGIVPNQDPSKCIVCLSREQIKVVFTAFLRAMGDYNTDQRGDVGSKCRLAAMKGLVGLANITTAGCHTDSEFFSMEQCTKIIGLLLKQFAEKLNFVREEAAKCLLALLDDDCSVKLYISNRTALVDALSPPIADGSKSVNYGDASITYPMVMKAAEIEEYFGYVIKGLVLSTGGLTKAITQNSSQVLIKWVRTTTDSKLEQLGNVFLEMFRKHQRESRVVLPLLKTIDMLLNRGCLERLAIEKSFFYASLLDHLRIESQSCKDVKRLTAIISVGTGLISSVATSQKALSLICTLLGHGFPRVRSVSAEKLYVRLLETNPELGEDHPSIRLLLEHDWESESNLQETQQEVTKAFGIDSAATSCSEIVAK